MDVSPKSESVAEPPAVAPRWRQWLQHPKVQRLVRHPIFPLMVLVLITQLTRDQFPFSHYPMYSMPTKRPLKWQYLADGAGQPLAHVYHTGISPSQVGKMYGSYKHDHPTEQEAGVAVLKYLRQKNAQRPKRPLPERIQLIETQMGFGDGHFIEVNRVVAEHYQPKREAKKD